MAAKPCPFPFGHQVRPMDPPARVVVAAGRGTCADAQQKKHVESFDRENDDCNERMVSIPATSAAPSQTIERENSLQPRYTFNNHSAYQCQLSKEPQRPHQHQHQLLQRHQLRQEEQRLSQERRQQHEAQHQQYEIQHHWHDHERQRRQLQQTRERKHLHEQRQQELQQRKESGQDRAMNALNLFGVSKDHGLDEDHVMKSELGFSNIPLPPPPPLDRHDTMTTRPPLAHKHHRRAASEGPVEFILQLPSPAHMKRRPTFGAAHAPVEGPRRTQDILPRFANMGFASHTRTGSNSRLHSERIDEEAGETNTGEEEQKQATWTADEKRAALTLDDVRKETAEAKQEEETVDIPEGVPVEVEALLCLKRGNLE